MERRPFFCLKKINDWALTVVLICCMTTATG